MKNRAIACLVVLLLVDGVTHAATGILELDSKPCGAEVCVDGKKKGTTPESGGQALKIELAAGDHEAAGFTNSLGMKFVPVPAHRSSCASMKRGTRTMPPVQRVN